MTIESGTNDRDVKIEAPGLHKGVYVDPSLRSAKANADVDAEDMETKSGATDEGEPRADSDDLNVLGFGPSSTAVDFDRYAIRQQFGLDADRIEIAASLDSAPDLDLNTVNASELALADRANPNEGFSVVSGVELKGWSRAGRIPAKVKDADGFADWRASKRRKQSTDVNLGSVLTRRITNQLTRLSKPDYADSGVGASSQAEV